MLLNLLRKIKGQRGFSLLEITIAMGLSGALAVGISAVVTNMTKADRGLKASSDFNSLGMLITAVLSNTQSCPLAFGKMANPNFNFSVFASGNPLEITLYNPVNSSSANALVSASPQTSPYTGTLSIAHLQLSLLTPINYSTSPGTTAYLGTLSVIAAKIGVQSGSTTLSKSFTVNLVLNNAGDTISGCTAFSDNSAQSSCLAMTGDPSYFNSATQTCNILKYTCVKQGGVFSGSTSPECDISQATCLAMGGTYSTSTNPKCTSGTNGWPSGTYCLLSAGSQGNGICPSGFTLGSLDATWNIISGSSMQNQFIPSTGASFIKSTNGGNTMEMDLILCCK